MDHVQLHVLEVIIQLVVLHGNVCNVGKAADLPIILVRLAQEELTINVTLVTQDISYTQILEASA